ncbi:UBA-like domain-containing protein [Strongyloides ratti]|uniref:UBA-like domain-containing protein n=1 Tax=Strongyloides ratti TaxID=34506 RepID=A0A090LE31_STRRB|nr:UBA-like domain-containing protein [Strongyloides ratti]CEF65730.1 UBA-like domain-containing protein [Strongyloides ratti]
MGAKNEFSDMKSNKGVRNRNNQPKTMKELIKSVVETAGCSDERAEAALKDHQMCLEDAILEIVAENGQESWVEKKSKKTKKQDTQEDSDGPRYDRSSREKFNTAGNNNRGSSRRGRGGMINDRTTGREDSSNIDWKTGKDVNFDTQPSDENQGPTSGTSATFRGGRGRGRGFSGRGGRGGPSNGRGGSKSYTNNFTRDNNTDSNNVAEENEELNWSSGPLVFTKKDDEKSKEEESESVGTSSNRKITNDPISYSSVLKPKQASSQQYMTFTASNVKTTSIPPQSSPQSAANNSLPNKAGTLSFAQVLASKPKVPTVICKDKNIDQCKHTDKLPSESDNSKISNQSVYDENLTSVNNIEKQHESRRKEASPITSPKTTGMMDDGVTTSTGHQQQAHAWTNQLKKDLGIPGQASSTVKSPKTQKTLEYVNETATGNIYGGQFEAFNSNDASKNVNESVLSRRHIQQDVGGNNSQVGVDNNPQKQGNLSSNTYSNNIHQQTVSHRAPTALSYVDTSTMSFPPNERSLSNSNKAVYGTQPGNSQQQTQQSQQQPQQHQLYNPPAQQAYSPYSNVPYYNMNLFNPVSSMRADDPQYTMFQFPLNMAHLDLNSLSNLVPTMNSNSGGQSAAHNQNNVPSAGPSHQRHNDSSNSFNDFRSYTSNIPNTTATSVAPVTNNTQQRGIDTSTSVAPPPGFNGPPGNMAAGSAAYFTQPSSYQNLFQYPPAAFHQHQQYPFNMMFPGGGPKMTANQMVPHQVEESNDIRLSSTPSGGNQQPKRNTYSGHHQGPVDYASNVSNNRDRERGSNSNVGGPVQNSYTSQSYTQMRGSGNSGGHHQQTQNHQNERMMQPKSNYNSHHWNT